MSASLYTIAAIPTVYRGRRYRSRLEARWAAFFDLLGWRHEYEPFDLGKWSPDFLLHGIWRRHGAATEPRPVLAEIKPITDFDLSVATRMNDAIYDQDIPPALDLLLLGVAPRVFEKQYIQIGWVVNTEFIPGTDYDLRIKLAGNEAVLKLFASPDGTAFDYADNNTPLDGILTSYESGFDAFHPRFYRADLFEGREGKEYAAEVMKLWAEATNRVQWHPREVRS
jgi:hypothetical protein